MPEEPFLKIDPIPKTRSYQSRGVYPHHEEREPKSRFVANLIVIMAVGGGFFYLLQLFNSGRLPSFISAKLGGGTRDVSESTGAAPTPPSKETAAPLPATIPKPKVEPDTGGKIRDCTLIIDSDPQGATLLIETRFIGKTPNVVSISCNSSITYTMRLEGYEPYSENVFAKEARKEITRSLKKIPMGTLKIVLNQNADILLEDGKTHTANAGVPLLISVRANRQVNIRFVNRVFNIDERHAYRVDEDKITIVKLELGDARTRRKTR